MNKIELTLLLIASVISGMWGAVMFNFLEASLLLSRLFFWLEALQS